MIVHIDAQAARRQKTPKRKAKKAEDKRDEGQKDGSK